jgi:hypothetical protein
MAASRYQEVAMSEATSTQEDEDPGALSLSTSDELKAFGFDPGIPVYEIDDFDFDLDRVKQALFGSTYKNPVTLPFRFGRHIPGEPAPEVTLDMIVEMVQAFYPPNIPSLSMNKPISCMDAPEWYLRGYVYKSGFDPYPETIQMHVYIATGGGKGDQFNHALVQLVRQPSDADPSTLLVRGDGVPGQE